MYSKNLDKPIEKIIDDIIEEINPKITGSSTKLQRFVKEYNKEFGDDDRFDNSDFIQAEVLRIIKAPLMFYALNMNGQVLIDLAGLLERYAILYIEELFKSLRSVQLFAEGQSAIEEILEKKFLKDLVKHLITLGLLDKEDEKKVKEINEKRNYVAHKNITKISAALHSNNENISIPEIDIAMSDYDVLPYVFTTIRLLSKMIARYSNKTEKSRIAVKLLRSEINDPLDYFF